MITFTEAYEQCGPDTMAIARVMRITESEADRLVNTKLETLYHGEFVRSLKDRNLIPSAVRARAV